MAPRRVRTSARWARKRDQLTSNVRDDWSYRIGVNLDDALFVERIHDECSSYEVPAGFVLLELRIDLRFTRVRQLRSGWPCGEDRRNIIMLEPNPDYSFY